MLVAKRRAEFRRCVLRALAYAVLAGLTGCGYGTGLIFGDPRAQAMELAAAAGFEHSTLLTPPFQLTAFARGLRGARFVVVYIEGDGNAWRSRQAPSADPTPRDPVALRLAVRDLSAAVLYLARPCQFLDRELLAACPPRYWTSQRYSEDVIVALDRAIDAALERDDSADDARLGLVGYSGGGALATLLAGRRRDVAWLVTVAGNLDHETWTSWHGVTPLHGSLNPLQMAERLWDLPQVHLVGQRDTVIVPAVTAAYMERLGPHAAAEFLSFAEFNHGCCWESVWPDTVCPVLRELGHRGMTPCGNAGGD